MKRTALGLALAAAVAASSLPTAALAAEGAAGPKILRHQAAGEPVAAGTDLGTAGQLPAGASQDMLPVTGEDAGRYYRLPQVQEGENVIVSAQLIVDPLQQPTSRERTEIAAQLVTSDGESCSATDSTSVSRSSFERLPLVVRETGVKRANGFGGCLNGESDEVFLRLERTGQWQDDAEIPVELHVMIEPALDPTTLSGQVPEQLPPVSLDLAGQPQPVSGGSGFSTATEVAGESVSSDAVLPFEVKYYKVHVAEGQRLNYRLTMGDSRDASANELATSTFSPLLDDAVVERDTGRLKREDVGASITRSTLSTVSQDLVDSHRGLRALRTPGYYFITVTGAARDPRGLNPLEYELAVQVTGEPTGSGAWEPALAAGPGAGGATATASGSWLPSSAQLGALLGGVAVALAGGGGVWLLRRRRRSS